MSSELIRIATRGSPLALRQSEMVIEYLSKRLPDADFETIKIKTTGDKQKQWNLEARGGKGLFTKELELALILGEADIAVHSAKDLPTEEPEALALAGFLPRANPSDVLITRKNSGKFSFIGTSSPRRRAQLKLLYPEAVWSEIRGNVDTRLKKVASGKVDATVLAAAGLERLGITEWEGLNFLLLTPEEVVPAVGQAAIALQTRNDDVEKYAPLLCAKTAEAVSIEREFLRSMGGGCHTAMGGYFDGEKLRIFHEKTGKKQFTLSKDERENPQAAIQRVLSELDLTNGD